MNLFTPQCEAQSVGAANQLFATLVQTILAVQCSISPPDMWPKDYGETALESDFVDFDFIVIGSGSSGGVVASRLSEIADWKVLLLEAGSTPPIESEIPGFQYTLLKSEYDWQFRTESNTACFAYSTGCLRPRGKMLGGTSGMNSMLYIRGHKHDFDLWSDYHGNPGWDYDSVLHYFKKSENNLNEEFVKYKNGTYHSDKGMMKVDFFGGDIPFNQVYLEALNEIGIETIDNVNADKVFGAADVQGNIWNGRRQSTAKAFLVPAMDRKNLQITYHAEVQKIIIDDHNRANGVEFIYKGKHIKAFAKKEVILSDGSIMSPKILMHSGIGPKDHLQELGIPIKIDLPVGKNLIEHIFTRIFFTFTKSQESRNPILMKLDDIYHFTIHNSGPLVHGYQVQATGFINSFNGTDYPDVQLSYFHIPPNDDVQKSTFGGFQPKIRDFFFENLKQFDIGFIFAELVQPKSRGYIVLNTTSPNDKPILRPNYLTNDDDVQALFRSIKRILAVLDTKAYKEKGAKLLRIPLEKCDHFEYLSDEYWLCYIRYISYPTNHSVGTSKMGPDSDAVVDSRLCVRGIDGLRQIDGGIMPSPVSGNSNAACIMIGEKGADLIKESYGRV
ncbi:glucose dehydrogenase [FAD, quinone]-like [Contarinia nasturtii]|uniref:glucose dehydrogenase [FAD, quinone]-like n=1 Tax=Contarinia nasturtii TaxID=265458 RepID=UPI0012D3B02A|nr:glucose dehydrogenase [FAD, quinone]-like [Contarinia nasturtii]